jgi:Na+-transporting NADH:ubiquinone oxidoreductase subunit C
MNKESPGYILFFITAVSLFFGLIISVVNYATVDILKKNEAMHKNRVLAEAFMIETDGASSSSYEKAVTEKIEEHKVVLPAGERIYYKNRDNGDIGIIFSGTGFWDRITGIIVLSGDLATVRNIQFLEQKETPGSEHGLKKRDSLTALKGLPLIWGNVPEKRIIIGSGDNTAGNRVDAITGATQTSVSLMNMLNMELDSFRNVYQLGRDKTNGRNPGTGIYKRCLERQSCFQTGARYMFISRCDKPSHEHALYVRRGYIHAYNVQFHDLPSAELYPEKNKDDCAGSNNRILCNGC